MAHKRYYGDAEVLRVRTRNVQQGHVMVKLRKTPGSKPEWTKINKKKYFSNVRRVEK